MEITENIGEEKEVEIEESEQRNNLADSKTVITETKGEEKEFKIEERE